MREMGPGKGGGETRPGSAQAKAGRGGGEIGKRRMRSLPHSRVGRAVVGQKTVVKGKTVVSLSLFWTLIGKTDGRRRRDGRSARAAQVPSLSLFLLVGATGGEAPTAHTREKGGPLAGRRSGGGRAAPRADGPRGASPFCVLLAWLGRGGTNEKRSSGQTKKNRHQKRVGSGELLQSKPTLLLLLRCCYYASRRHKGAVGRGGNPMYKISAAEGAAEARSMRALGASKAADRRRRAGGRRGAADAHAAADTNAARAALQKAGGEHRPLAQPPPGRALERREALGKRA